MNRYSPPSALDVARAHVRVTELDRRRTELLELLGNTYDQLRDLHEERAAAVAQFDQIDAGYRHDQEFSR